jgi:peptide/nickel transport system substrate-binding protein
MKTARRTLAVLGAAAAVLLAVTAAAAAGDSDEKVVLTVGITSTNFDTLNPIMGYSAVDYDVWNTQYGTLTNKAAKDFAPIPGLAESWQASDGGRTYTYKLRDGLTWSDGTPLTAKDIVFTINRSREEEWQNYSAFTQNLTARAIDDRTVEVTSKIADPKLPGLGDVYILPEHIWGKLDAKAIVKYAGLDGVGSGPFTLIEFKRGQFVRMKANPGYSAGERPVDEIVFRIFNNADAMVAALKKGEIDAAHNVPSEAFDGLRTTEGMVAVEGNQGGFDEIAINGGAGLQKPHPALLDRRVRVAMAHAIDKQVLLDRVWLGIGSVAQAVSPSADPAWTPVIPPADQYDFDLAKANKILDDAGYKDTNGDGIRELPGGGKPLDFSYYVRSESEVAPPVAEFVSGWMKKIGIKITQKPTTADQLTTIIGKGTYDMFHWSWTPYVDPDPQISYFRCSQIAQASDPGSYNNDANWCDPVYDKLYKQQNVELDRSKRLAIVHEMLTRFHDSASYNVIALTPDLQAYRTDRFTGWLRQPAAVGPVIFSNTSPTYASLAPIGSSGAGGGGLGTPGLIGILVAGLLAIGIVGWLVSRRRSADERE